VAVRIGFGCVGLGSASGPSGRSAVRLVHAALDAGVTVFDTADAYGSGASERTLGRALAGRRDQVEIATKGGYRFQERSPLEQRARRLVAPAARRVRAARDTGGGGIGGIGGGYRSQDFSPAHLRAALEGSLRRLGTDHVDVYQLHGPRERRDDLVPLLRGFVDAGLVRRIGIGAEELGVAVDWICGPHPGAIAPDVVQVPFGPLDPGAAEALLPQARRGGVEVWARGVFGGGLLAAARSGATLHATDRARVDALRSVAREVDLDLFGLAVGFVRSFPEVDVMMLGMSTPPHLERNLELVRSVPPLPPDVVDRVRELADHHERSDGTA
jgi:aryl-alcohol dehydrogenase-like predicted oxidoreductase